MTVKQLEKEEALTVKKQKKVSFSKDFILKIIPLGGLEEVGRNLTAFELVKRNGEEEIIILDVGLGYPDSENMMGVDYIIPNVEYLENKKDKIIGILITHGHYDHIGAIPYLIEKLGNPPIYTTPLTKGLY